MGLTHALEAPHPFIFLSIIYLATVMPNNCALEMTQCNWIGCIVLLRMITYILWFTWLKLTQTKDKYLHSIFFLSRGQTTNQTTIAMTRAKPMEMSSTPHHGRLSKPSTAVPSFTGGKGPSGVSRGRKERCLWDNRQHVLPSTNSIREWTGTLRTPGC